MTPRGGRGSPRAMDDESGGASKPSDAKGDGAPESAETYRVKRRPMWPFFAVLLLIAGGIASVVVWRIRKPEPLRVLVAIDLEGMAWDGSRPASKLTDEVSQLLANVGFEPVKSGDPKVDKILAKAKTPEDAARELKAAFVIGGRLEPKLIEQGVAGGFVEARVDAAITVRQIEDAAGKVDEGHVSTWSGAHSKEQALDLLAGALSDLVFDEAAPRMMAHPSIQSLLEGDDIQALSQIQKAKNFVALRKKRLDAVQKAYADLDKERANGPQKIRKITYHGHFDEADALAGTGPEGFLVQTVDVAPFVSPSSSDLGSFARLERLEWRPPGEGAAKVVWTGYHLYGYPSAAPGGSPVVFVEDIFGWAKTLTVLDAKGEAKRVRVDPSARFVDPKIAPGGKAAALYVKPCRSCGSTFVIASLENDKTLYDRKAASEDPSAESAEIYGGYTWLDDHRAVLLVKPRVDPSLVADPSTDPVSDGRKPKDKPAVTLDVLVVDVSSDPPRVTKVASLDGDASYSAPTASPDGKSLALAHGTDAGDDVAILDLASGRLADTHAASAARNPEFSPDGTKIVFSEGGDIKLLSVADGKTVELTENEYEERYPMFSADGKTVYFESLGQDPNFRRRQVAVVASVEVAP